MVQTNMYAPARFLYPSNSSSQVLVSLAPLRSLGVCRDPEGGMLLTLSKRGSRTPAHPLGGARVLEVTNQRVYNNFTAVLAFSIATPSENHAGGARIKN